MEGVLGAQWQAPAVLVMARDMLEAALTNTCCVEFNSAQFVADLVISNTLNQL